jgi:hypothetical protein
MQKCGEITDLETQKVFELIPKQDGEKPCTYVADFVFKDKDGELRVVDSKGYKTEVYRIKRKLLLWRHNLRILEVWN